MNRKINHTISLSIVGLFYTSLAVVLLYFSWRQWQRNDTLLALVLLAAGLFLGMYIIAPVATKLNYMHSPRAHRPIKASAASSTFSRLVSWGKIAAPHDFNQVTVTYGDGRIVTVNTNLVYQMLLADIHPDNRYILTQAKWADHVGRATLDEIRLAVEQAGLVTVSGNGGYTSIYENASSAIEAFDNYYFRKV